MSHLPPSALACASACHRAPRRLVPLALAAAGLLAAAAPAWADQTNGFGVSTAAAVNDPYPFIWATSAYRTLPNASGTYTLPFDVAPVSSDPCPGILGSGFVCEVTLSGSTGPGYNLTASHSQAAMTTSLVAGSTDLLHSSAQAHADLASARLGLDVVTGYRHGASAFAGFNDTLSFQVAGASASTVTLITVGLTLVGELDVPVGLASIQSALYFGTSSAQFQYAAYGTAFGVDLIAPAPQAGGWVSHSWDLNTPSLTRFTGVYALTGATAEVGISNWLIGYVAEHDASALYGNAATLSLTLPQEVTYTSASGVFLTSAVPEPATTVLWALGLGGAALLARRRRPAAAAASLQSAHDRCAASRQCP